MGVSGSIDATGGRGVVASTVQHLGPLEACPGCGATSFQVEEIAGAVVFVCDGCRTGWRFELDFVWPVESTDPESR